MIEDLWQLGYWQAAHGRGGAHQGGLGAAQLVSVAAWVVAAVAAVAAAGGSAARS
jgi:hypothetical protein